MNSRLLAIVASAACAGPLSAQSFNIDFGEPTAGPSAGYAAAGLPGYWNAIHGDSWITYALNDVAGNATNVQFQQAGAFGLIAENDPSLSGDDALLMNDGLITYTYGVDCCFYFNGLEPGVYELITYAWRPNHPSLLASSHVDNTPGVETSGGAWPGAQVHGVTYAREIVTVTGSGFMGPHSGLDASSNPLVGAVCNGIQLRRIDEHSEYCFGDGSGSACPCSNSGSTGNGCANSVVPSGGHLTSMGATSVANDTFVLVGNGMPNSTALYLQGTTQWNGGNGTVLGDGLRCVGGSLIRLGAKTNSSNGSMYPQSGDLPISQRGALPLGGGTRMYQAWYRNPGGPCGTGTNLTNGIQVTWVP
jgi:hypothetical protein